CGEELGVAGRQSAKRTPQSRNAPGPNNVPLPNNFLVSPLHGTCWLDRRWEIITNASSMHYLKQLLHFSVKSVNQWLDAPERRPERQPRHSSD
ncbi:hypothetical protein, partial [Microvirga sp. KLBC 81]|uniref:hypothetical protein n=1 Tax=Microvirga sp. KLBC 81 TaxID=1862707 RepID=UPI00197B202E